MTPGSSELLVFGSVGTDHHPFDRMVEWLDDIARTHPAVRVVVQHGHSRAPEVAEGHAFLSHEKLTSLMAEADVVVCHGGPGTIMDARSHGKVPVCVPRNPGLGEHVDGHQMRFVATIATERIVTAPADHDAFKDVVAKALEPRKTGAMPRIPQQRQASGVPALVQELEDLLDQPRGERPGRLTSVGRFLRGRQA